MLMALLAMIGLAPTQAAHDPCLGPAWAVSERMAVVCDFKDASAAAIANPRARYAGSRTGVTFSVASFSGVRTRLILVSDKAVDLSEAQKVVPMIGANGGWVDASGIAHGAADAWALDTHQPGTQEVKAGALVALLPGTSN